MSASFIILSVIATIAWSCTTTSDKPDDATTKAAVDHRHGTQIAWHAGSLDEALAAAKRSSKMVFVYWGAQWCPPCNEVKAEIFSHQRFPEVMSNVLPVWLDGDSERAQAAGERLQISGYPTLLLLDGDGKEILRLSETLNFEEFKQSMANATSGSRSLSQLLDRAAAGKAEDSDWQLLASMSWYDARGMELNSAEMLAKRRTLVDRVPPDQHGPAAVLAGKLLAVAAGGFKNPSTQVNAEREAVRQSIDRYLGLVFRSQESVRAARSVLIYDLGEILTWGYPTPRDASKRREWAARWKLETRRLIEVAKSEDERLSIWMAHVEAEKMVSGRKDIPRALLADVKRAVESADRNAKSVFQRQTVIPTAAYVLQEVGETAAARDLLLRELKRSKTPWYISSGLAQLEEKLGNKSAALQYAAQATKSVAGQASRIQWIASDLLISVRLNADRSRVNELTKAFYDNVFSVKDGFSGRNWSRLGAVEKQIRTASLSTELRPLVAKYQSRCGEFTGDQRKRCDAHFDGILNYK